MTRLEILMEQHETIRTSKLPSDVKAKHLAKLELWMSQIDEPITLTDAPTMIEPDCTVMA